MPEGGAIPSVFLLAWSFCFPAVDAMAERTTLQKNRKENFLFSYLAAAAVWFGAAVVAGRWWSISGASKKYAKQPTESSV